jgi:6-phosphogluconate dehydrogenase
MGGVYILMGVSGVGKTSVGKELAVTLGLPFFDADDFHPQRNKEKMAAGIPLNDTDRWPWLDTLAQHVKDWSDSGAVLACSALKEVYRERLCAVRPAGTNVTFVYLQATFDLIRARLSNRKDHFFNPTLLQSQFDTLEPPKNALQVDGHQSQQQIIDYILLELKSTSQLGLIGLGVMGKSLARNFAGKGIQLSLYNRRVSGKEEDVATRFITEYPVLSIAQGFEDLAAFVQSLERPRSIFLMVHAGAATDIVISALHPHLDVGDVLMDGGNAHYQDTERRIGELSKRGIHFMGVGVSGGEEGALYGPSIMPGGAFEIYDQVQPLLEIIAAKDAHGKPCCAHIGIGGAGHFVKMIHNGIEYAEMQLITEVYGLMRFYLGMELPAIANQFDTWNAGPLQSYLLEISAKILRKKDGDHSVIDLILDKAQQKGTGGWSTTAALTLGQPFDTIASAVMVRNLSAQKMTRIEAQIAYAFPTNTYDYTLGLEDIKQAYSAARMINHAIGIETIKAASITYGWNINLSELARVWTNGCIIRSQLMEAFIDWLKVDATSHILLHVDAVQLLSDTNDAFAKTISESALLKAAIPTLSAAFNYFNGFVTGDSATHLIQAQRDFFGAHTYERKDKEGNFHTQWE